MKEKQKDAHPDAVNHSRECATPSSHDLSTSNRPASGPSKGSNAAPPSILTRGKYTSGRLEVTDGVDGTWSGKGGSGTPPPPQGPRRSFRPEVWAPSLNGNLSLRSANNSNTGGSDHGTEEHVRLPVVKPPSVASQRPPKPLVTVAEQERIGPSQKPLPPTPQSILPLAQRRGSSFQFSDHSTTTDGAHLSSSRTTSAEEPAASTPPPSGTEDHGHRTDHSHGASGDLDRHDSAASIDGGGVDTTLLLKVIHRVQQPCLTLVLYLQSAPVDVIFAAFQADCERWGIRWYSGIAQRLVVFFLVDHPVSRRYPPRHTTLRTLLKQYITLIEQPDITQLRKEEEDIGDKDPVEPEVMEAYIWCSVTMGGGDANMCYKSFYNLSADVAASSTAATSLMIRKLVDGASFSSVSAAGSLASFSSRSRDNDDGWDMANPLLGSGRLLEDSVELRGFVPTPPPECPSSRARPPSFLPFTTASSDNAVGKPTADDPRHGDAPLSLPAAFALDSCRMRFDGPNHLLGRSAPRAHTQREEEDAILQTRVLNAFCPLKVAVSQFSNVGLSLWPAAFVLAQLVAQEIQGQSRVFWPHLFPGVTGPPKGPLPPQQRLRVLELGAGVGLTPAFLSRLQAYRDCVDSFVITDYQSGLLDNIRENLRISRVTEVEDLRAASRGLEGDKKRPFHLVAEMDWTDKLHSEVNLVDWEADLILAADCIYDVNVIPAFADTVEMALKVPLAGSVLGYSQAARGDSADAASRTRTVVVVQTHRQNSTMKVFFDRIRTFAHVQSFTLVMGKTAGELFKEHPLSKTKDGLDGGVVPLGEWPGDEGFALPREAPAAASRSALESVSSVVCALRPDTVLEDGSIASITLEPSDPTPNTLRRATTESLAPPSRRSWGSFQSNSSNFSLTRSDTASSRVKTLLKDELIGSFYTPMAGLIGVHVIQLKKDAGVASGPGKDPIGDGNSTRRGLSSRKPSGMGGR